MNKNWINIKERLPEGQWSTNYPHLSEEVLVANSCAVCVGFYNRNNGVWYTDEPAMQQWIDKITHWMKKVKNSKINLN